MTLDINNKEKNSKSIRIKYERISYNKGMEASQKQRQRCTEQTSGRQGMRGVEINQETGIDIYTPIYINR